jgi:hypothetical protein
MTSLADCKNLRTLNLSNQSDKAQVAYLAKKLNSQLDKPLQPYLKSSLFCSACGSNKRMFIGRRMPFLCQQCDAKRFSKLESEFEQLVLQA